jgi:hypothetical protein
MANNNAGCLGVKPDNDKQKGNEQLVADFKPVSDEDDGIHALGVPAGTLG